jgi:hypothetical protein
MADSVIGVDRFKLIRQVGSGGMGEVWQAWDNRINREVAIKIIAIHGVSEADRAVVYQRTVREAQAAARIKHDGIAAVYDVFEAEDRRPWIVMEFVAGRSLDKIIDEAGPVPLRAVAAIGVQVLDALTAGHRAGVVHRDLKPANIMISPGRRAVLTDFGIAALVGSPALTQPGSFLGTPGFIAPERMRGVSTATGDLWSFGATLYAAVVGRAPYASYLDFEAIWAAILTGEPPTLPASIPLSGLIRSLMSRDPADRPDAALVRRELAELAMSPGPDATATEEWWTAVSSGGAQGDSAARNSAAYRVNAERAAAVGSPAPYGWQSTTAPVDTRLGASGLTRPDSADPATGRKADAHRHRRRPPRRLRRRAAMAAATATVAAAMLVVSRWWPSAGSATAGASLQGFRVAAAVGSAKTPQVFAVDSNGALLDDSYRDGGWAKWEPLTADEGKYTGTPAVVSDQTGRLEVFVRSQSGQLMRFWQSNASANSWQGPTPVGARRVASDPTVIKWPRNHVLEVFAELPGGSLGTSTQVTTGGNGAWSDWQAMGGTLGGAPAAAMNADGHPEVFALQPDGNLAHIYWQPGSESWSNWSVLQTGDFTGVPAAVPNAAGDLEVFLRTTSGVIDRLQETKPSLGPWSAPVPVSPAGSLSDPAAYQKADGTVEVFAESANRTIGYAGELGNGQAVAGWAPWTQLGGTTGGTAAAPCVVNLDGTTAVLVRLAKGSIAASHATAGGNWSAWTVLSGGAF